MRIAEIATVCTPVRRDRCGSVESIVWLLARELTRAGHEVTIFATADSEPPSACELVPTLPAPYGRAGSPDDWQLCEWINICRAVEQAGRFDVLHSHGYLFGVPLQQLCRTPMVHTLHVLPAADQVDSCRLAGSPCVTAISAFQWSAFPHFRPAAVIHHGVDPDCNTFEPSPQDYVCYMGRFLPEKGPLVAIAAAREAGLRLILAGPANPYFHKHIEPCVDGRSVEYAGYVAGAERSRLLGGARALLYPLQHPEAFGLVVTEAMMCGTPVVALRCGAVPELVEQGISGYHTESMEDFVGTIPLSFALDRRKIRQVAESRFSARQMAEQYCRVFEAARQGYAAGPTGTCVGRPGP